MMGAERPPIDGAGVTRRRFIGVSGGGIVLTFLLDGFPGLARSALAA